VWRFLHPPILFFLFVGPATFYLSQLQSNFVASTQFFYQFRFRSVFLSHFVTQIAQKLDWLEREIKLMVSQVRILESRVSSPLPFCLLYSSTRCHRRVPCTYLFNLQFWQNFASILKSFRLARKWRTRLK